MRTLCRRNADPTGGKVEGLFTPPRLLTGGESFKLGEVDDIFRTFTRGVTAEPELGAGAVLELHPFEAVVRKGGAEVDLAAGAEILRTGRVLVGNQPVGRGAVALLK